MCWACEKLWERVLLHLAADVLTYQIAKPAFRCLTELVVAIRFLAHHEPSTVVAGIEPLRGRGSHSTRAIKSHPRAHLDKRTTLGKLRRILILHTHQRGPLIVFEYAHRADRNLISCFGLSNRLPLSGGTDEGHHQDGRGHNRENEEEGLFQCKFPKHQFAALLWGIRLFLSIRLVRIANPQLTP